MTLAADHTLDDATLDVAQPMTTPVDRRQRGFWYALAGALFVHSLLLINLYHNVPHAIGSAEGTNDAIAVDLVTEADLESRESVVNPLRAGAPVPQPPPQPVTEPKPPQPPTPPPQAEAPQPPETAPPAEATPPAPAEKAPPAEKEQAATEPTLPDLSDIAPLPDSLKSESKPVEKSEPKPEPAKPQPPAKKKPPTKQAKLDLSPPTNVPQVAPGQNGRAAASSRPPGITRSGANDEFGRGVIRALRATMPAPNGVFGSVTVKLVLNNNGDLAQVVVLQPSGKPSIDQNVVFSTKQAYFPLPPPGATEADKTFLITYVYR